MEPSRFSSGEKLHHHLSLSVGSIRTPRSTTLTRPNSALGLYLPSMWPCIHPILSRIFPRNECAVQVPTTPTPKFTLTPLWPPPFSSPSMSNMSAAADPRALHLTQIVTQSSNPHMLHHEASTISATVWTQPMHPHIRRTSLIKSLHLTCAPMLR